MTHEWHGARGTLQDGVFITEADLPGTALGPVKVEISRQNSNLNEVKHRLALQASRLGANAISGFRYGQRRHSVLTYLNPLRWDTEGWYGQGEAKRVG